MEEREIYPQVSLSCAEVLTKPYTGKTRKGEGYVRLTLKQGTVEMESIVFLRKNDNEYTFNKVSKVVKKGSVWNVNGFLSVGEDGKTYLHIESLHLMLNKVEDLKLDGKPILPQVTLTDCKVHFPSSDVAKNGKPFARAIVVQGGVRMRAITFLRDGNEYTYKKMKKLRDKGRYFMLGFLTMNGDDSDVAYFFNAEGIHLREIYKQGSFNGSKELQRPTITGFGEE